MSGKYIMDDEQSEAGSPGAGDTSASAMSQAVGARGALPARDTGSTLGGDVQARIGQHLRAMYDDVVRQGVPDRFMDLLSQLDKKPGGTRDEETGR